MSFRLVSRLLLGPFVRPLFMNQVRNNSRQQYQWSRLRSNYDRNKITTIAVVTLSSGIAFALYASTVGSDKRSATSTVDYNQVRKSVVGSYRN